MLIYFPNKCYSYIYYYFNKNNLMVQLFISYSSKDLAVVERLRHDLRVVDATSRL